MYKIRKVWDLSLTYVGAVVGAGFASGQELMQFFVSSGSRGLWGALAAGLGFMLLGMLVFRLAARYRIASYREFLILLLGERAGAIVDGWLSLYLFAGVVIMLAGCGAAFREYFAMPTWLGVLTSTLVLLCALLAQREGVLAFNAWLVPVMILGILAVGVAAWPGEYPEAAAGGMEGSWTWVLSALLYVSYNMISGMVILVSLTNSHQREGALGALLGGLLLGVLAWLLCAVLLGHYRLAGQWEVPLLQLARQQSPFLGLLYALVLWLAMLTSALVNALGLALRLSGRRWSYPVTVVALLVIAAGFSHIGFSLLIKTLYPFFGYINLLVLAAVLAKAKQVYIAR